MFLVSKQESVFVIEYGLSLFKCHLVFGKILLGFILIPLKNHIYIIYIRTIIVNRLHIFFPLRKRNLLNYRFCFYFPIH